MSGEWISLDVGGVIFKTTVATLTQDPNSMLAAMFDPESELPPARKDDKGNFLIDRDPEPFRVILGYLRNARLPDDIVGCSLQQVQWEASYFGLDGLLKTIEERNKAKDKKEEAPKMSWAQAMEKAAEMNKKSAEAWKIWNDCYTNSDRQRHNGCNVCEKALSSAQDYNRLGYHYKEKAREMEKLGMRE